MWLKRVQKEKHFKKFDLAKLMKTLHTDKSKGMTDSNVLMGAISGRGGGQLGDLSEGEGLYAMPYNWASSFMLLYLAAVTQHQGIFAEFVKKTKRLNSTIVDCYNWGHGWC